MSDTLAHYIAEAHRAGMTLADIGRELSAAGWTTADLAAALQPAPTSGIAPARSNESVIVARNVSKKYKEVLAVDNISFDVRRGEIFGILGPNGAGKTTTLEMIEGLRRPTGGAITVDGKNVLTQTQAVKEIIGVQPQSSAFFDGLTLRETLDLFASLYGRTVDPMVLLAEVQLTEKADSEVKELSGGQKQRFSIAVGLVNDPIVLFLDEPTTGLDPQARHNLWDLVRQINARGTTIVLTTHYMEEAEVLCDRIAVMDHAHIVALDDTQALLSAHGENATLEDVFLHLTGDDIRE
jgi:ABC-2 type transport system ATP-binding protein